MTSMATVTSHDPTSPGGPATGISQRLHGVHQAKQLAARVRTRLLTYAS